MLNKKTLDKDTRVYLEELLAKSTKDLDSDEIAFLMARRAYLTEKEFESIPKNKTGVYGVDPKPRRK